MDLPARKRRRTSSPGGHDRSSSPLKQRPRRPSFASPTKASLARFNPNLLPQPTSASASASANSRGGLLDRGKNARAFIFGETDELATGDQGPERDVEEQAVSGVEVRANTGDIAPRTRISGRVKNLVLLQGVREEEDLPPTPTAMSMEPPDTPRRGVLFSSPSKRPPRAKDHAKASLLKPKHAVRRTELSPSPAEEPPEGERGKSPPRKRKKTPDPEIEQRRHEKAKLQKELRELEREVAWCSRQVEVYGNEVAVGAIAPPERNALIKFINKVSQIPEDEDQQPVPTSNLLCSFLPFSAQLVRAPKAQKEKEKPVPSHQPLELDDPLPYLQMFTPFNFTSHVTLPTDSKVDPATALLQQRHTIDIVGPAKLLTASLEATIDSVSHEVVSLELPKLSAWTEKELGTFCRRKAQDKDLSTVCWAIGSYWEIARKRAEYRHRCESAFAHLLPERTNADPSNPPPSTDQHPTNPTRKDLVRHLGRDAVELRDRHILLRITWRIGFDWTGEAESLIDVQPAFPKAWTETDEDQSLSRIPETFRSLLESRGVFQATKAIVALLFSE